MPKCRICGFGYKVITNTHLRYAHNGLTQWKYLTMFPEEDLFPMEVRNKLGPVPGSEASESTKKLLSLHHSGGMPLGFVYSTPRIRSKTSDETKKLISESNKTFWNSPKGKILISQRGGWKQSEEAKRKISEWSRNRTHTDATKEKISKSHLGKTFTMEHRRNMSKAALELWSDPEFAEKQQILMHQGMRGMPWNPNMLEYEMGMILETNFPRIWKYNGSGGLVLGKYIPDFTRLDGIKQVIEVFGSYWHSLEDEEKKKVIYRKFGYGCLVIWEYDIWIGNLSLIDSIKNFMEGGN